MREAEKEFNFFNDINQFFTKQSDLKQEFLEIEIL